MKALGLLEVYSFTTAVTAADICAKSGGVKVIAFDRNRPKSADAPAPLVMVVKIEGDVADVREIVDEAIDHANRKNLRHFTDLLLAKRYDDEDMIILRERDFLE